MAHQSPAFYFFHLMREVGDAAVTTTNMGAISTFPLHDSRQGELMISENDYTTEEFQKFNVNRVVGDADQDAVDTIIVSGHNLNNVVGVSGNSIQVITTPTIGGAGTNMLPVTDVLFANGAPFKFDLTVPTPDNFIEVRFQEMTGLDVPPEMSEVFLTIERELVRGPEANWEHSWRRTQRTFENDAGVVSTLLLGAARKTHRMTWRHLFGADRQILLDLREQTSDFSQPWWFRPPDTAFPLQFVTLDRDATWVQDFLNPLESGTSDRVSLPMIEVLG